LGLKEFIAFIFQSREFLKDCIISGLETTCVEEFQKNASLLWVDIKGEAGEIYKFITTHLPVTIEGEETSYQLEVIDLLLREIKKFEGFVLCGDTNAPRGKISFSKFSEKYKDNIPEEYKTTLDQNLHRVKGLQYMIDCLFTTPNYTASNVRLIDGISDHMAVVAEITKN
jgi:endonuclease/exonuclease/phosphatase family metal-dependent hydrolase